MVLLLLLLVSINVKKIEMCSMSQNDINQVLTLDFLMKHKCVFCFRNERYKIYFGPQYDAGGWNPFDMWIHLKGWDRASRFRSVDKVEPNTLVSLHVNLTRPHSLSDPVKSIVFDPDDYDDPFLPSMVFVKLDNSKQVILFVNEIYVKFNTLQISNCYDNLCSDGYYRTTNNLCKKCRTGYYGFNCTLKCYCKNQNLCDSEGNCGKYNCPFGRTGKSCEIICPVNTFGPGCTHKCFCKNKEICDIKTGICRNGCAPNYIGNSCRHDCLYGKNCLKPCKCKNGQSCNKKTGRCQAGKCIPRYFGINCQKKCPDNKYGKSCGLTCYCRYPDQCKFDTGICMEGGCLDGWFGRRCDKQCPNGQLYCQNVCRCKDIRDCSNSYDYCPNGCGVRYYGTNCKYRCAENRYLINGTCSGKCHCANIRACNVTNGACVTGGCRIGYTGDNCQILNIGEPGEAANIVVLATSMTVFIMLLVLSIGNIVQKSRKETRVKTLRKKVRIFERIMTSGK